MPDPYDLSIEKSVNKTIVAPGEEIEYTFTITNESNSDSAKKVVLEDLLPPGMVADQFVPEATMCYYNSPMYSAMIDELRNNMSATSVPASDNDFLRYFNSVTPSPISYFIANYPSCDNIF